MFLLEKLMTVFKLNNLKPLELLFMYINTQMNYGFL